MYATIQEADIAKYFPLRKRKKWTGWRRNADVQNIEFKKEVMENRDEKFEENLGTIRNTFQVAAGKVAYCTKAERETFYNKHRRM